MAIVLPGKQAPPPPLECRVGPNVFLAWNCYRLYCHYAASKGAEALAAAASTHLHAAYLRLSWQSSAALRTDSDDAVVPVTAQSPSLEWQHSSVLWQMSFQESAHLEYTVRGLVISYCVA